MSINSCFSEVLRNLLCRRRNTLPQTCSLSLLLLGRGYGTFKRGSQTFQHHSEWIYGFVCEYRWLKSDKAATGSQWSSGVRAWEKVVQLNSGSVAEVEWSSEAELPGTASQWPRCRQNSDVVEKEIHMWEEKVTKHPATKGEMWESSTEITRWSESSVIRILLTPFPIKYGCEKKFGNDHQAVVETFHWWVLLIS